MGGDKNICEIGKERIRRAGDKVKVDNVDKGWYENLDIGFRVLKLDDTNMNVFTMHRRLHAGNAT